MIETYRMLGHEREVEFEREAERFRRGALVPRKAARRSSRALRSVWARRFQTVTPARLWARPFRY
jgi:hypothetical protein